MKKKYYDIDLKDFVRELIDGFYKRTLLQKSLWIFLILINIYVIIKPSINYAGKDLFMFISTLIILFIDLFLQHKK